MSSITRWIKAVPVVVLTVFLFGCDETEKAADTPAATTPTATTPPTPSSAPTPTVTAAKPSHPCPEGSKGEGTFKEPCVAEKKTDRLMEVTWTGKITDKGPSFRVVSKSDLEILYGQIFVYFYDKAGKQLEVPGKTSDGKARTHQTCAGNIFAGPMKPGEKAVLWFSCVNKDHVPEGAVAIEGELRVVGFTAEGGKKADTYWRNEELTPAERPKGGIKK